MTTTVNLGTHAQVDPPRSDWEEPCPGQVIIVDQSGPIWSIRCERCGWEAGLPRRRVDPSLHRRMLKQRAGFPARFAGVSFQQDRNNAFVLGVLRKWVAGFGEKPLPAPAIHGDPGRGKSHLLVSVCEEIIDRHSVAVLFRSSARLLDDLQDAFDTGEYATVWNRALTVDLLALDDLGAERATEWRTDRLARLVDERWERELPIVMATNYSPNAWGRTFDARTASRLRGMTFGVQLAGSDRRQMAIVTDLPRGES